MTSRLIWIDWAKVFGMFLVVAGHVHFANSALGMWIFSFHMPLFFLLSGMLEKPKPFKESFFSGVKTLLVPYVILYLLSYPIRLVSQLGVDGVQVGSQWVDSFVLKPFLGLVFAEGGDTSVSSMVNIPLWFLVGLFWCKVGNSLVERWTKGRILWVILANVAVLILFLGLKALGLNLLFSLDSALLAFPFFSLGRYWWKLEKLLPDRHWVDGVLSIGLALLTALLSTINGRVDINASLYGSSLALFYVTGLIGSAAVFFLAKFLGGKGAKVALFFSTGTLITLAFHGKILGLFLAILRIPSQMLDLGPGLALTLVVFLLCAPLIWFFRKYLPIVTGFRR